MEQGYYPNMDMTKYLSDPCKEPSLSTSTIETLVGRTALRARFEHPRFGKAKRDFSSRLDIGSAIHNLATENGPQPRYVESATRRSGKEKGQPFIPTDWKTEDAREAAEEIRASGAIPLLLHQREQVENAANAVRRRLSERPGGKPEVSMVWQDNGVWHRGRSDWLIAEAREDVEIKTVECADPVLFANRMVRSMAYDVQGANRLLGHKVLTGEDYELWWLLVEIEPPFETAWLGMDRELVEQATRRIRHAQKLWRKCLDTNNWPSYEGRPRAMPSTSGAWDLESRGVE